MLPKHIIPPLSYKILETAVTNLSITIYFGIHMSKQDVIYIQVYVSKTQVIHELDGTKLTKVDGPAKLISLEPKWTSFVLNWLSGEGGQSGR